MTMGILEPSMGNARMYFAMIVRRLCMVRKEKVDNDNFSDVISVSCCQRCVTSSDEEKCDVILLHTHCKAEHLKTCSKKSRAQRLLSTAIETISTSESDLTEAREDSVTHCIIGWYTRSSKRCRDSSRARSPC